MLLARITIDTDVVRENNQTYRLGWSEGGYSHEEHVELAKALERIGKLPASFMLFPSVSRNQDIWTDIARMRTLNMEQSRRNQEMHVCPLQLDIIRRLITRYTNAGETVLDPFGGIMSVPFQAIKMGRKGIGIELNREYWRCGVGYCEMAESELNVPTLFDLGLINEERPIGGDMAMLKRSEPLFPVENRDE